MGFEKTLNELKIVFDFENVNIKVIEAKQGAFFHSFPRHMHSFYELHYIVGGKGTLILDDNEYQLSKGMLFLLGPKTYHAQLTDMSDYMEEYCFSFEVQYNEEEIVSNSEIIKFFKNSQFYICEDNQNIQKEFENLKNELITQKFGYVIAVKSLLRQILLLTIRNFICITSKLSVNRPVPDDRRTLLMDEAFLFSYQTLTLESLSKILNLSTRHTERLIYEKYDTTFVKMRMQARLNAAVDMILEDSMKLSEISQKCGFSSYIHFLKAFKEMYKESPSHYKKRHMDISET